MKTPKMNIVDRTVAYFNPAAGVNRIRSRAQLGMYDTFTGASGSKPSMKSWSAPAGDADSDSLLGLDTQRRRSRDLMRNSPIATGVIRTTKFNVVGSGLKLDAAIDKDVLSMTDQEAKDWERKTEMEFALWAEDTACDAERTLNFYGLQDLAFGSVLGSGDCFATMPMIARGKAYDTAVNLIEADRCCNPHGLFDNDKVRGGIEFDAHGAPIKYHFRKTHPGSIYSTTAEWTDISAFNSYGLRNVIHLYEKERIGQSRGIPFLSPVIEALKQLERYTEAELMAAVLNGMFAAFATHGDPDDMPSLDGESAESDEITETKLTAGTIIHMNAGDKVETIAPGRPNEKFEPFFLAIVKQIGAALGVPFEILIKHFQSSFSASQAAMHEAWRFFKTRRVWLATYFCAPIYERWMWEAVAKGRIYAPGFFTDPLIRRAYLGSNWVGPAKGMINELQEANAAEKRMNIGVTTLKEETANMTGGDWEKKSEQRGAEVAKRRSLGLEKQEVGV